MSQCYIFVEEYGNVIFHKYLPPESNEAMTEVVTDVVLEAFLPLYKAASEEKRCDGKVYEDIRSQKLSRYLFSDIKSFKEFTYGKHDREQVWGMLSAESQFIRERYPQEVVPRMEDTKVMFFDIENEMGDVFIPPTEATLPINAITMKMKGREPVCLTTLPVSDTEVITVCENEAELLKGIVNFIERERPDVISGYNSKSYDIVYIVNRLRIVLGMEWVYRLSYEINPHVEWKDRLVREGVTGERNDFTYTIAGLPHLDYMELWKKYSMTSLIDNRLETVAQHVVGEGKTENPYPTLKELYEKDPELFLKYNIQDVVLLDRMDDVLMFINLAFIVSSVAKCNVDKVFAVTNVWDSFIYQKLRAQDIIIPPKIVKQSDGYGGGYVKAPILGRHEWCCSFDLTSEYPMVISQCNISPETLFQDPVEVPETVENDLVEGRDNARVSVATELNMSVAGNGTLYRKDRRGIVPDCVEYGFGKRAAYKKTMKEFKVEKERVKEELIRRGLLGNH